ncbi:ATP-binding protein [Pedobacter terrae]|uniref:ATP-binding protein n=1 Tax=Pedobacter terrae TaxID=405671 RepID=UPI002FF94E32
MNTNENPLAPQDYLYILSQSKEPTAIYVSRELQIGFISDSMMKLWKKDNSITGQLLSDAAPEFTNFIPTLQKVWDSGEIFLAKATPAMIDNNGALIEQYFDFEYRPVKNAAGQVIAIINTATNVSESLANAKVMQEKSDKERFLHDALTLSNNSLQIAHDNLEVRNADLNKSIQRVEQLNTDLSEKNEQINLANHNLHQSEERFRTMAEGTDVMIALSDGEGKAVYFNKAWEKALGGPQHNLLEFGWMELIHPEDKQRVSEIYFDALNNHKQWIWEFRMPNGNGGYRWLLASGFPRFNIDGSFTGYVSSTIDITERKESEQRKNDFIGMVSHELKTPVTSLKAYIDILIKMSLDGGRKKEYHALQKADQQLARMTSMINSFLSLSLLESGEITLNKSTFSLNQLLCDIAEEFGVYLHSHQLKFQSPEHVLLTADRDKICQVIINLINNAVKFSPRGSTISVCAGNVENKIIVQVKDEGIGISLAEQDKIFESYHRVENSKSKTTSGFGIGLYLSKQIVEQHQGVIDVESQLGKGATFSFQIPELVH